MGHESLEKLHKVLSELSKNCEMGKLETELARDIFFTNMRNVQIQKKFRIKYLIPKMC